MGLAHACPNYWLYVNWSSEGVQSLHVSFDKVSGLTWKFGREMRLYAIPQVSGSALERFHCMEGGLSHENTYTYPADDINKNTTTTFSDLLRSVTYVWGGWRRFNRVLSESVTWVWSGSIPPEWFNPTGVVQSHQSGSIPPNLFELLLHYRSTRWINTSLG